MNTLPSVRRRCAVAVWPAFVLSIAGSANAAEPHSRPVAPKIWDDKALASWSLPIVRVNATPRFYTEAEYYAAPVVEQRTYPVYHPDSEPPGYWEWLQLVSASSTSSMSCSFAPATRRRSILRDRENLKTSRVTMTPDGRFPLYRWVVEERGRVRLGLLQCASCHMRIAPDGTLVRGPFSNLRGERISFGAMIAQFEASLVSETGKPLSQGEANYVQFGVPWLKDDIHAKIKTMPDADVRRISNSGIIGTFARFNGSPYYTTRISDLIGVKDRRYLDHTATHRNRGPEDVARYTALVSFADDGAIGSQHF